jgi:hypothetical protein
MEALSRPEALPCPVSARPEKPRELPDTNKRRRKYLSGVEAVSSTRAQAGSSEPQLPQRENARSWEPFYPSRWVRSPGEAVVGTTARALRGDTVLLDSWSFGDGTDQTPPLCRIWSQHVNAAIATPALHACSIRSMERGRPRKVRRPPRSGPTAPARRRLNQLSLPCEASNA